MKLLAVFFITAMSLLSSVKCYAQTQLAPGDIAIIGFNFKDPDQFTFVIFEDIDANTEIHFTDCGWKSDGGFRINEGMVTYKAPESKKAGSIITFPNDDGFTKKGFSGFFGLTVDGDQILAFQNDTANPQFLFALNSNKVGWDNAVSNNTTALPETLVNGVTALSLNDYQSAYYDCLLFKKKDAILAAVSNPDNWIKSSSNVILPQSCGFVLPLIPSIISVTENNGNAVIKFRLNFQYGDQVVLQKAIHSKNFETIRSNILTFDHSNFTMEDIMFGEDSYYRIVHESHGNVYYSEPIFLKKSIEQTQPVIFCNENGCKIFLPHQSSGEIYLFSFEGEQLYHSNNAKEEQAILEEKLQTLSSGLYFISYISNGEFYKVKFIR